MYPINVFLVGNHGEIKRSVRRELSTMAAEISKDFADATECLSSTDLSGQEVKLFVVLVRSAEDVEKLGRLNDSFVGFPILAVVEISQDPGLLVGAMRAGAAQVVRTPVDSRDFQQAMQRIATQFGHARKRCEAVAIVGAAEGVGVSSTSINLADEIARRAELECVLVEGTASFGHLAHRLNISPAITTYELTTQSERLDGELIRKAVTSIGDRLQAIVGPYREIHPWHADPTSIGSVEELIRQYFDIIVVDMAAGIDDVYFEYLHSADQIVLVGEQRLAAVTGMKTFMDQFRREHISARLIPVLNKYDRSDAEITIDTVRDYLEIDDLLTIRRQDALFREAENSGRTLHQTTLRTRVFDDFKSLADLVLHQEPDPAQRGFLSRLTHALHR